MNEIERASHELRLSGIADTLNTRLMQARAAQQPFLETFTAMPQDELDWRRSRLTEGRFKHSKLDERLTLADFTGASTQSCRAKPALSCMPWSSSPKAIGGRTSTLVEMLTTCTASPLVDPDNADANFP